MEGKRRRAMWIMTCILIAVSIPVLYMTHRAVTFMMDDKWYATMLYDESIPITSFSDIVESQVWHYHHWGGRSMTHGILQMTLLAGERAADVLNVVFTLLLAGMICLVSDWRRPSAFLAAIAMPLGLNANWMMSMFWQSGAVNYLYITVFILAFVFCYLRELSEDDGIFRNRAGAGAAVSGMGNDGKRALTGVPEEERAKALPREEAKAFPREEAKACAGKQGEGRQGIRSLPGITLWIIPLGILAGWSNENMGPAVWLGSLAVILLTRKAGGKVRPWMYMGNLACLLGSVICIAAPGNRVRSLEVGTEQFGALWKLFLRSYGECRAALEYLFPVLLVLGFLLLLGKGVLKLPLGGRNVLLLFMALLSWGAFFLSPHYPDRATFGTMVLCICVCLSLAKKILRGRPDLAWPLWGGALFIWLRGMYFCGEYLTTIWGWIR